LEVYNWWSFPRRPLTVGRRCPRRPWLVGWLVGRPSFPPFVPLLVVVPVPRCPRVGWLLAVLVGVVVVVGLNFNPKKTNPKRKKTSSKLYKYIGAYGELAERKMVQSNGGKSRIR